MVGDDITKCTFYYQYYLHTALWKTGMSGDYIASLEPWRDMIDAGLSTCPETPEPTRSDCHAWSASPNFNLLAITCGIRPSSPDFRTVHIEPDMGPLTWIETTMPHPEGTLKLRLQRKENGGLHAEVTLPGTLTGTFTRGDSTCSIGAGRTELEF